MNDSKETQVSVSPASEYWQLHGMHCDPFQEENVEGRFFAGADRQNLLQSALHMTRFATQVMVFAGAQGVGKTTLLQAIAAELDGVSCVLGLQSNFSLTLDQLFEQIGEKLGLPAAGLTPDALRSKVLQQLQCGLPHSRSLIVLVDDAEELPEPTLAGLLALANDAGNSIKLLLFAATDANHDVTAPLRGDALQRVDIAPLDLNGVEEYLRYRLITAGYRDPFPFTQADLLSVLQHSGGIPEHIHAMAEQKLRASLAEQPPAVASIQTQPQTPAKMRIPWLHVAASLGLTVFIAAVWSVDDGDTAPVQPRLTIPPADSVAAVAPPERPKSAAPATRASGSPVASQQRESASARPATAEESPVPAAKSELPTSEVADEQAPAKPSPSPEKIVATQADTESRLPSPVKEIAASASVYTSDERHLLGLPASHYTLQLVGSKSLQGVQDFASSHKENNIIVFRQRLNNKPWYVAVTGDYPNQEQATTALVSLPKALRDLKPWARPLSKVQGDIKSARERP